MRNVLILILLLTTPAIAGNTEKPVFSLKEIIPTGETNLEIMTIGNTSRTIELTQKLQASMSKNRDWFLEHIKKAKPGEPLDYDPRLGLTKKEYDEYLIESKKTSYDSTGQIVKCKFVRNANILSLELKGKPTPLNKLMINLVDTSLSASVGYVGIAEWRSSDGTNAAIGPWEGYSWKFESGSADTFTFHIVSLKIVRLKKTGKILWIFKDSEVANKNPVSRFEVLFQHDAPKNIKAFKK